MGNYCVTRPARIVLVHPFATKCRVEPTGFFEGRRIPGLQRPVTGGLKRLDCVQPLASTCRVEPTGVRRGELLTFFINYRMRKTLL